MNSDNIIISDIGTASSYQESSPSVGHKVKQVSAASPPRHGGSPSQTAAIGLFPGPLAGHGPPQATGAAKYRQYVANPQPAPPTPSQCLFQQTSGAYVQVSFIKESNQQCVFIHRSGSGHLLQDADTWMVTRTFLQHCDMTSNYRHFCPRFSSSTSTMPL